MVFTVLVLLGLMQVKQSPAPASGNSAPTSGTQPGASASSASAAAELPPWSKPDPGYRLPVGQTYVYDGEWRIFNAGTATLRADAAGQEQRIVGTADSSGTVALLYHVHDRFESFA